MATKTDYSDTWARWISVVLGPVLIPILFLIVIFNSHLATNGFLIVFFSILILLVVIPLTYLVMAPKLGWVQKWDLEKKEERKPFMILILVAALISLGVVYFFGNKFLFDLFVLFLFLFLVLFLITIFWKISLHVSFNVVVALVVSLLFNWKVPFIFLIIPLVFWARWKLKKHTLLQLTAGLLLPASILLAGFKIFGYI